MSLHFSHCLPHTSFLGFQAAINANIGPYICEVLYLFYSYNVKSHIDYQTKTPSFWFNRWRPAFLITSLLWNIAILAYCLYEQDIFAVLLIVRIVCTFYQLSDTNWLIKHWIPFFVQKEKRKFIFLRLILMGCIYLFVVGSTSWAGSWQERNDLFASVYYISVFLVPVGCTLWYLIQGGVDHLIKYRLHWLRNIFALFAFGGLIIGVVGLIVGDGGGNLLVNTLNYHSAFILIYFGGQCQVVTMAHRFVVHYEELSWKHPISVSDTSQPSPSTQYRSTEAAHDGTAGVNNKVACCDIDLPDLSIKFAATENIPKHVEEAIERLPETHHIEDDAMIDDHAMSYDGLERMMEEDGKEGDLEAARGLIAPSTHFNLSVRFAPSVIDPSSKIPLTRTGSLDVTQRDSLDVTRTSNLDVTQRDSLDVTRTSNLDVSRIDSLDVTRTSNRNDLYFPYRSRRRYALAFDGIVRSSFMLRRDILTQQIMMVKLKRHELVCREVDKLCCVVYQLFIWETVMWIAQIFLTLYLQSVDTPTIPGAAKGYYCPTPLEHPTNTAQFVNDFVFARR